VCVALCAVQKRCVVLTQRGCFSRAGAEVDRRTHAGNATSLHRAAFTGHADVIALLCACGAAFCALRVCAAADAAGAQRRLAHGADAALQDADGETALHKAAAQARRCALCFYT
jgi:ankyrin repeat protein